MGSEIQRPVGNPIRKIDLSSWAPTWGWSMAGVTPPEISAETQKRFQDWLNATSIPGMKYLWKRQRERLDIRSHFPPTQSVLCFGLYYFRGWAKGPVKVSNYAWGNDYHRVLTEKLEKTVEEIKRLLNITFEYKICVDTAPLLEKALAVQAGVGWQGKNTLVLNPRWGSTFFLGEILTSLPLSIFEVSAPIKDYCGKCRRCIEACPTDALKEYRLDPAKCISYWNLEHRGEFLDKTPPFHNWVAGCDICQEVCPWNSKILPLPGPSSDLWLQNLSEDEVAAPDWAEKVKASALSYVPPEKWKINLKHLQKKS